MKFVREILRGLLIGIAGAAPGVSGGALAVSMGVYDKIIGAVTHLAEKPKESVKTLFPYFLGAAAGISMLSFIIEVLFVRFPFASSMAFIGLILGGAPAIKKKAALGEGGMKGYAAFLIVFCLMILLVIAEGEQGRGNIDLSVVYGDISQGRIIGSIGLVCAGLIGAATMVIPGVSGTMLLMMMGYYQPVLSAFNKLQTGIFTGNLPLVMEEQKVLLPYGLGLFAGIFLCAHMVECLMENYESLTYSMILALILSSPIVILWGLPWGGIPWTELAAGIVLAILGTIAASRMEG